MENPSCPKCESEMTCGYLVEKNTPTLIEGDFRPTEWVTIEPEYFEKYGFFQPKHIIDRRRVDTYRCNQCGFLESFAIDIID